MIINDFINKIKNKLNIDTFTFLCLLIIIGVGIASFGLGRLSALSDSVGDSNEIKIIDSTTQLGSVNAINLSNEISLNNINNIKEKRFVASKNGKLYYSLGCSGAKRISEKNAIWFNTKEEAEKSGYEFSSSCK